VGSAAGDGPPNMSPNITVNNTGIAVTSTSCSDCDFIFMGGHARFVTWVSASHTGTDLGRACDRSAV